MKRSEEKVRVVGLGGTLREDSTSLSALEVALGGAQGAEVELLDLRELELPMYEPGKPLEEYTELACGGSWRPCGGLTR